MVDNVVNRLNLVLIVVASPCVWLSTGCSHAILSLDDVVAVDGQKSLLVAHFEREPLLGLRVSIEETPIHFYYNGQNLAQAYTDEEGRAAVICEFPHGDVAVVEARAEADGQVRHATSRLFRWPADRTVIAVDVDDTISETDYDDLLLDQIDRESRPLPDAQEALTELAETYRIVYVTGRPRFLLNKTRDWLDRHDFPAGPVITSPGVSEMLDFLELKIDLIRMMRTHVPALLIGLGDKESDAKAYAATELLPLILRLKGKSLLSLDGDAIVFDDWPALLRFFEDNGDVLSDPKRLTDTLRQRDLTAFHVGSSTRPAKPSGK